MKKTSFLLFLLLFLLAGHTVYGQSAPYNPVSTRSAAIVLKISGESSHIQNIAVFSFNSYNGKVKISDDTRPVKTTDILKIKVLDENNNILLESFYENPLTQNLESFEENGAINNNILPDNTGFINIRFPFPGNVSYITINCYTVGDNDTEVLVSTLKYKMP